MRSCKRGGAEAEALAMKTERSKQILAPKHAKLITKCRNAEKEDK